MKIMFIITVIISGDYTINLNLHLVLPLAVNYQFKYRHAMSYKHEAASYLLWQYVVYAVQ